MYKYDDLTQQIANIGRRRSTTPQSSRGRGRGNGHIPTNQRRNNTNGGSHGTYADLDFEAEPMEEYNDDP